jgi:hypothetical protein
MQYCTAVERKIALLLTRNARDFKKSMIQIMNPEAFLSGR